MDTLEPIPSTTLLSAQEAGDRLRERGPRTDGRAKPEPTARLWEVVEFDGKWARVAGLTIGDREFADSSLEGSGFEPLVPR